MAIDIDSIPVGRPTSARIYVLKAREARRAVIFRRGPSNAVRLLTWNLRSDRVTPGQWLKKRVYERRCDLTPDGGLLIYFAADWRAPYGTFTAVSKPPYFTALALWGKGDAWGGGGLFPSEREILLNHRPEPYHAWPEFELAEGFFLPPKMTVRPFFEHSGWGEDDPIRAIRLQRDGWRFVQNAAPSDWRGRRHRFAFVHRRPEIVMKTDRERSPRYALRIMEPAVGDRRGRWNVELADIVVPRKLGKADVIRPLGRVDWADIDDTGDILWAWNGLIHRLKRPSGGVDGFAQAEPRLVADLNGMTFEAIPTPEKAKRW